MSDAPSWADNPFGSDSNNDALSDPAVTQASTMPEYDPFTNQDSSTTDSYAAASPQPVQQTQAPDWAEKSPPKKKETKRKAAPVTESDKQREEAYAKKEQDAEEGPKDPFYRPANWPPMPKSCCWPFRPCFHHDFQGEIPEWGYSAVKIAYYKWVAYVACLFWNMVCCFAALGLKNKGSDEFTSAGLSVAFFFLLGPLGYLCWFQSLYQAMRKDSSLRFGWFFFTFTFQWITSVLFSIGIPRGGSAGVWVSISAISQNTIIGILMFTSAGLWICLALFNSYILKQVLMLYRSSGQSLQKAQQEAVSGAAPHVANVVIANQFGPQK
eukprot:m.169087 g.169087  ORF g.169087 m.169087 type:complete len:325 (+) comp31551_c2_seq1:57-1031(+)